MTEVADRIIACIREWVEIKIFLLVVNLIYLETKCDEICPNLCVKLLAIQPFCPRSLCEIRSSTRMSINDHTVSRLSIDLTNELQDDLIWQVMLYRQCDCTMQIRLLYSSVCSIQRIFTTILISEYSPQITLQLAIKLRKDVGYVKY